MKSYFYTIVSLISLGLLGTLPLQAQSRKILAKQLEQSITRQTFQRVSSRSVPFHPVFGYVAATPETPLSRRLVTPFSQSEHLVLENKLIQVVPVLSPVKDVCSSRAFSTLGFMLPHQLTQAFYLWRLGHPQAQANPGTDFYKFLTESKEMYDYMYNRQLLRSTLDELLELPNLQFLKHLTSTQFEAQSYAQLAASVKEYPKHVRLGNHGFPVHTPQAPKATLLDNYLILSNPKEMGVFNNAGFYTPFVLTPQEQAAADNLLARYRERFRVHPNPTPRALIELAYNRLETHTVKYTQISQVGANYQAYPNYKNTQLYRSIKGILRDQTPLIIYGDHGPTNLGNEDIVHLIVLDAIMGGVDDSDLYEVLRALDSFEALCAGIHPKDKSSIAHARILQENLRLVFYQLARKLEETQGASDVYSTWDEWEQNQVTQYAWRLFYVDVQSLVGKAWQR